MMNRSYLKYSVGLVALVAAGPVWAADVLPPPAPSVEVADTSSGSCLYTRLDVGVAIHEPPTISVGGGSNVDPTGFAEVGVGCQLLETFRVEAVVGARYPYDLGSGVQADMQTSTAFVNLTYDITNYAGWTPYIGGGVGAAFNRITDVVAPATASDGEELSFAWNVHLGVSYDMTSQSKVDFGYRLSDLGGSRSGGPVAFTVDDMMAHEFKIGVRYNFGSW
ncbi:MAG: outer membrane beta-barrel protein [Hyphomicrobiales bacterium]|nr:outer membrane beta-barrel protein [Hyphomicrobiales bacterium]